MSGLANESKLLVIGRFHGVTEDFESSLLKGIKSLHVDKVIFVITASDKGGSKRHPFALDLRKRLVNALGRATGRPFTTFAVEDIADSALWVSHVRSAVIRDSRSVEQLDPSTTIVFSSNPETIEFFRKEGFQTHVPAQTGSMPVDLIQALATNGDWRSIASSSCRRLIEKEGLQKKVAEIFGDLLLNDDGELSSGRDFSVYSAGMDASMAQKIQDICVHIKGGRIVDKGCGTGTFLVHLGELYPDSEIVGVDLSREMLRSAESKFYRHHNVAVVSGNIVEQRFADDSLSDIVYSSVMHEVYSYNKYDRDQVRSALRNSHRELIPGGRLIIRDGIKPEGEKVWLSMDSETEERFRRFAREFKNKSDQPGVSFVETKIEGKTWFLLGLHEANEFLSKKDYLANWAMEVNEEFGVFTLSQWEEELEKAGYKVVSTTSYLNPWILENRYLGKAALHADESGKPGRQIQFPDTTAVIVAEKP